MHSLGNDFVMLDASQFSDPKILTLEAIKKICDRHFGIGGDLLVFYKKISSSVINVRFFNPDGTEAELCGNAMRCIGLLMKAQKIEVCVKCSQDPRNYFLEVGKEISFFLEKYVCENSSIDIKALGVSAEIYHAAFMNVGNPHLVLFVTKIPADEKAASLGKFLENHKMFLNRTNVGFVKVISETEIELLVFERGVGLTLACGTGAYAALAASIECGFTKFDADAEYTVHQRGGDLKMRFFEDKSAVQIGSASMIYSGNFDSDYFFDNPRIFSTEKTITVYTDGACKGNPGPGGWAAVIIDGNNVTEIAGSEANTTNNRMELMAAIQALQKIDGELKVYTDSKYLMQGITEWLPNWIKRNWKNSANEPVKNKDLWQKLVQLTKNRKIKWNWVKGHSDNEYNNRADELASAQCNNS